MLRTSSSPSAVGESGSPSRARGAGSTSTRAAPAHANGLQGRLSRLRADPGKVFLFAALLVIGVLMVYPFAYMVISSLRGIDRVGNLSGFSLGAWRDVIGTQSLGRDILNSMFICVVAIAIIVVCSSAAGYAFAKLPFRGRSVVFAGIVTCLLVPIQSIIIPLYTNFARFHLINTYVSAIITYAAVGIPFGTFLMTSFFRGLPDELLDAALCDGLGHIQSYWRVGLAMAKPALAAVAVLQFILIWNDLLIGLLFLQTPQLRTITVGLGVLISGNNTTLPLLMAASVLSAVPAALVYAFFQRYLVAGLTVGVHR